jgi:hypothetical protein
MDIARCTQDDVVYQAITFAGLSSTNFVTKKRFLICSECGGPAFFRKASCSGQAACFGARPHEEGCSLKATEYEKNDEGQGDDQDILENPGQRIVVEFNYGAQDNDRHNDPTHSHNTGGQGGRFVGDGHRPNAVMRRRISTILRNLIISQQFRNSQQILEIDGVGEFTIANFFVPLQAATEHHINKYHGFWGMVADGALGQNGELWLNSGGRGNMSVCIPEKFVNQLYKRFRIHKEEDIAGAYVLVFGTLCNSRNGKKYVPIKDAGFITLQLA